MNRTVGRALLFSMAIVAAFGLHVIAGSPVSAQNTKSESPDITVSGTGSVDVAPDVARVDVGVQTTDYDSTAATRENATKTAAVLHAVKALGVAAKDIRTLDYGVSAQFQDNTQPPALAGYLVSNTVRVTVRSISQAGTVLDAALRAGANSAGGIQFDLSDPKKAQDEALAKAVADATRKARVAAKAAGISAIRIAQISESGSEASPRPMLFMKSPQATTPIQAGEQTVTANVTVRFLVVGSAPVIAP